MKFLKHFNNRNTILLMILILLIITYVVTVRLLLPERDSIMSFIATVLHPYFYVAEHLSNVIIHSIVDGVYIQNKKILFTTHLDYFNENRTIIENWRTGLFYLSVFGLLSLH